VFIAGRFEERFCERVQKLWVQLIFILQVMTIYILQDATISPQAKHLDYRYLSCGEGIKSLMFVAVSPKSALYLAAE
jgi:hypothetical protein